jgi:hypothetical protein
MKIYAPAFLLFSILFLIAGCTLFKPIDKTKKEPAPAPGTAYFDYWMHSPLHPDDGKAVTFTTKVSEPMGIATISLQIYEYELYLNQDQLPSKRKRRSGQWGKVKTWMADGQTEMAVEFRYLEGFPKASQVQYVFTVTDKAGKVSQRIALFDAGTSLWPQDKILLYSPGVLEPSQTFNLCFFPDVDYEENWGTFLDDSRKMIFDGFHQSNVMKDQKERWAFYYTQQQADGLKIAQDFHLPESYPDFMKSNMISGIDAFTLLHQKPYSDGSYMYGNIHFLAQTVFTTESYNYGTAIHEMGHAVFQLSDEYNGCACFQPAEGFSNVFETETACQDFLDQQGLSHQHCQRIISLSAKEWFTPEQNVYFPTEQACQDYNKANGYTTANCITFIEANGKRSFRAEEGLCIMNDDGDAHIYPFQEACMAVVNDYYERWGDQLFVSNGREPAVLSENIFGYEPVVYLTMNEEDGQWSAKVDKIDYGIPAKQNRKGNGARLSFMDNNNLTNYQLQIDRPGEGHFCGGNAGFTSKQSEVIPCMITVPYTETLKEVLIENRLNVDRKRARTADVQRVDLRGELERAAKVFRGRE